MPCDICSNKGHILRQGKWTRCECTERALYRRDLGFFNCDSPNSKTQMKTLVKTNLVIEGPLASIRPHVAGVILFLKHMEQSFQCIDAYRLIEIYLDKDAEIRSTAATTEADLFVMMLGFGEVKNQRLPDLIMQTLQRRELLQKPTWVILGLPLAQVATRFSIEVADSLKTYQKVRIQ